MYFTKCIKSFSQIYILCPQQQVAQLIAKLEKKKLEAVATERFEYAKKIKSAIGKKRQKIKSLCPNILTKRTIISSTSTCKKHFKERKKRASKPKVSEDDKYVTLACID